MTKRAANNKRPKTSYSAPALEKGLDVIELLADAPGGLTVSEIALRLGRSMSELFRIIIVMDQRGWLRKEQGSDRYRVTYKMLELAHRATPAEELTHAAAPILYDFAQRSGQSCHLVIQNGEHGLVALRQENPGPTGFSVRLGAIVGLVASCSGHVLLAFAEEARRGVTIDPDLQARLEQTRARGYEQIPSIRCDGVIDVSAPVFGYDGHVIAALTMPFLAVIDGSQQMDFEEARAALLESARRISTALGWVDREDRPPPATLSAPPPPTRKRGAGRARQTI